MRNVFARVPPRRDRIPRTDEIRPQGRLRSKTFELRMRPQQINSNIPSNRKRSIFYSLLRRQGLLRRIRGRYHKVLLPNLLLLP